MNDHLLTTQNVSTLRQKCAISLLALFGWRVHFVPLPEPRGIVIVYPHTSNWDFFIGLVAKWAVNQPFRWIAKESLFSGPSGVLLGSMLRAWGGEPVERNASSGAIDRLAKRMQKADWYWLALAPEGTRSYRSNWRSGFYHIALAAKVPVVPVSIDYATRTVNVERAIWLCGDKDADRAAIAASFEGRRGYKPECESLIDW